MEEVFNIRRSLCIHNLQTNVYAMASFALQVGISSPRKTSLEIQGVQ